MNNYKKLFLILLLIPFFIPDFLLNYTIINRANQIIKLCIGAISIMFYLKKQNNSKPLIFLILFYLTILVSSIIHGQLNVDFGEYLIYLILFNSLVCSEKTRNITLESIEKILFIIIVINFITMIAYPNGMYSTRAYDLNWFMGYKNVLIRKILPYLTLVYINSNNSKIKIWRKLGILISVFTILLSQSMNGVLGLIIFFLAYIYLIKMKKSISLKNVFIIYGILAFVFVGTGFISNNLSLLNTYFDKNASMRGRLAIWSIALQIVKNSPIIGYGYINSSLFNLSFNISHPHNLLLYYLMLGGVLGLFFLVKSIMCISKGLNYSSNKVKVIIAMYCSYLVIALTESLIGCAPFFIPFLILLYYISEGKKEI